MVERHGLAPIGHRAMRVPTRDFGECGSGEVILKRGEEGRPFIKDHFHFRQARSWKVHLPTLHDFRGSCFRWHILRLHSRNYHQARKASYWVNQTILGPSHSTRPSLLSSTS